jgi:heat shock protein HtpX
MYSQISENKTKTWMLLILMGSFTLLLCMVLGAASGLDVYAAAGLGGAFTIVYALISYYFSDKVALFASGAKPISKAEAPELYNIVENLCIANGQPTPAIYLMNDDSPNAFATGRDPEHASVAFTTGLLRILNKQELEGVAAHELSHVKNYDIRVMTIVVVLVGAVMLLSDILLRSSFGGNKKEAGTVLLIIGLVLAILSPILAEIIKLAVSRQREYLADASGALLTRYPKGLASALQKISAHGQPLKKANHATAHLFISSPFGAKEGGKVSWFSKLFATHPPVEDRIARLTSMGK